MLIRWSAASRDDQRRHAIASIATIEGGFVGVRELVHGPNLSLEAVGQEFDYAFLVTFESMSDLEAYLRDPKHDSIAGSITAAAERVVVADLDSRGSDR